MTKEIDSTDLLKKAIRNSEAFEDGFCIVCGNHTDSHSPDCLMNDQHTTEESGGASGSMDAAWHRFKGEFPTLATLEAAAAFKVAYQAALNRGAKA